MKVRNTQQNGLQIKCGLERGTVRVNCLAQEHNALSRPGFEPRPLYPESSALTITPMRHQVWWQWDRNEEQNQDIFQLMCIG